MATRGGARLAYHVVALPGEIEREVVEYISPKGVRRMGRDRKRGEKKPETGLVRRMIKQPAGYLVYFPRGHVVRFRDEEHLAQYGLDKEPSIINMQGLHNPNSPIGKLLRAQDEGKRAEAFASMEKQVIQLATAKTGPVIMPEQTKSREQLAPEAA